MSNLISVPAMNLKSMGFMTGSGNQLIFDSKKQIGTGEKIFVLIPVQTSNNFVSFKELFVNLGLSRKKDKDLSIRFDVLPGGRLKQIPSYSYNNLLPSDQDKVDNIIKKVQSNLKRWNGSEFNNESDGFADEPAEFEMAMGA